MEGPIRPPALAGLEGFEVWDRRVSAPEDKEVKVAFVSVRVGGAVGFNKACYKMWGEPRWVRPMFDPERRRLAFKPVAEGDPKSCYELSRSGNNQVSCKSLFDYYGVEIKQTRRYHDPKVIDGVLIVDL